MQCKDISDTCVLRLLKRHRDRWVTFGNGHGIMPTVADAMPPETPKKLQLAKMRQLLRRGLVRGCGCGCRGDFEISDRGLLFLAVTEAAEMSAALARMANR